MCTLEIPHETPQFPKRLDFLFKMFKCSFFFPFHEGFVPTQPHQLRSTPSPRPGSCGKPSSTVPSSNISGGGGSGATWETAMGKSPVEAGNKREFRLVEICRKK